ncbi:hypothetical protein BH23CHL2_BH23CHL2_19850 [soil metagenome]
MSGPGDRLHDVRQRPTFQIDRAAIAYIPRIGPAAWAVYCYLLYLAADGDTRWPATLAVASACGISTYNAQSSIETLLAAGMVVHHRWTGEATGPSSFAIVPISVEPEETARLDHPIAPRQGTDRLVAEEIPEEERWRVESEERNQTRELFSRMLEALNVDPSNLSEPARSTVTEASRLARAAGATPEDVDDMIDRIRDAQPELVDDAERMLEYWSELFAEMSEDHNGDPEAD